MEKKREVYELLIKQIDAIMEDIPYRISNLANAAALIFHALPDLNWAGFYLMQDGKLVLGPFQGREACIMIPVGRGVCGTAVERKETILVKDVHEFPGHIACDSASESEIVIPLIVNDLVIGVLDIDSPVKARFDEDDQTGLEKISELIEKMFERTE